MDENSIQPRLSFLSESFPGYLINHTMNSINSQSLGTIGVTNLDVCSLRKNTLWKKHTLEKHFGCNKSWLCGLYVIFSLRETSVAKSNLHFWEVMYISFSCQSFVLKIFFFVKRKFLSGFFIKDLNKWGIFSAAVCRVNLSSTPTNQFSFLEIVNLSSNPTNQFYLLLFFCNQLCMMNFVSRSLPSFVAKEFNVIAGSPE